MAAPPSAAELALRALRVRDRTAAELDARLSEHGVGEEEREEALAALARSGYVDDRRVAHARAVSLAERGSGDAFIRADLAGRGVAADLAEEAVATLDPERARAGRIIARRGWSPSTARYLSSRGFSSDTLAGIVAQDAGRAIG